MKTVLRVHTLAAIAVGVLAVVLLSGCSLFNATINPIFGETATEKTRTWAADTFIAFNKGWIPALALYHDRAQCGPGVRPPCWEPDVYHKLYVATDAATACQVAATAPGVDIISLQDCIARVTDAKLEFTQHGISPLPGISP